MITVLSSPEASKRDTPPSKESYENYLINQGTNMKLSPEETKEILANVSVEMDKGLIESLWNTLRYTSVALSQVTRLAATVSATEADISTKRYLDQRIKDLTK